jgi:hypothetical protein
MRLTNLRESAPRLVSPRSCDAADAAAVLPAGSSNVDLRGVVVDVRQSDDDDATLRAEEGLGWSREWYMDGDPIVLSQPPRPPRPPLSGEDARVELPVAVECGGVGTSTCFSSDVGGDAE